MTHLNGNKTSKIEKPKLKKRKKTKKKQLPTEEKVVEKEVRPRKRVKKVREHLEEIKRMQAEKQAEQNGVHLIQVQKIILETLLVSSMLETIFVLPSLYSNKSV